MQALTDDIRRLCILIRDNTTSNHDEWPRVSCLSVGSESLRVKNRCGPLGFAEPTREFVGEVSSFADLLYAKTDISGVGVCEFLFKHADCEE